MKFNNMCQVSPFCFGFENLICITWISIYFKILILITRYIHSNSVTFTWAENILQSHGLNLDMVIKQDQSMGWNVTICDGMFN